MSKLDIVEYPDNRLRLCSQEIQVFDDQLQKLVNDLTDTLYATTGIGLSAPQVGVNQRVLIMDLSESKTQCLAFVNPTITHKAGYAFVKESCLSLPGISASVIRAAEVTVTACNTEGEEIEHQLQGMAAICLQHEIDHLDGALFIDRISRLRTLGIRKKLKTLESAHDNLRITASAYNQS
ncbi:MAG: peptide deformylase [Granulosicoccus sp.]|nr:peptide deformylase [Granulosicoccus sp.]